MEEVVIGATSAADPLSCIVERRISNEAKTIPKQIHFDAAYAGNAFDTVPYNCSLSSREAVRIELPPYRVYFHSKFEVFAANILMPPGMSMMAMETL